MSEGNNFDYEPERLESTATASGVGSYSLRWNSFQAHLTKGMGKLLEEDEFTDVTLACDGQFLKAHKLILSLCSPYFKRMFKVRYILVYQYSVLHVHSKCKCWRKYKVQFGIILGQQW